MKVTSVAVAAAKFPFGMCDCTVDSDVGTGDFSLVLGILHVCGHSRMRSHVPPDMDCGSLVSARKDIYPGQAACQIRWPVASLTPCISPELPRPK